MSKKRTKERTKGIRIKVTSIQLIEETRDVEGVQIETNNTIGTIKGNVSMTMRDGKVVIDLPNDVVIHGTGNPGVGTMEGGIAVVMNL